ncbi:drug/metabolite transporter (DMT)-like permease [Anoxybacillus vitaminiphilus]|uniref:Drug/metabolite transporter (DMT)-like permease n=1 Tax=Paranoxybacillus vitaminiphilus TaxID=581036 RepID=A0A327YPS3_9BACL|nr:DMT family transporter [Anoxybacillus vitaminiphilus]RAK23114.1 drug/metabolite transporter (DMT)-like permease [Anoxybacillus vitaminiphilus]
MEQQEEWKYYFLLLFTSFLWGGNFVAGKFLVGYASPLVLTEMRWLLAIACLLPFVWWKERRLSFPKIALLPLIFMGLTGVLLFNLFLFKALEYTTADNVGLLSTLNPISIAIVSYFVYKEKLTIRQCIAMAISFIGILIVMIHGDWRKLVHLHFNIGDLYMLGAVAIWGLYSVFAKEAMKFVSAFKATLWSGIFGAIMIIPFISSYTITEPNLSFWSALIYTGVGATVLAMIFWNIGIQKVGSTKSGMFLNFNPIFTALLAYILLGEKMYTSQLLGSIIVISGLLLFTSKPKQRENKRFKQKIS